MFNKKINNSDYDKDIEVLITEWRATKNQDILSSIIKQHLSLINKISNNYSTINNIEQHDLVSEGILGLIHGLEKFQPSKNVKFSTYAFYWIRSRINLYVWKMKNLIKINLSNKNYFILSMLNKIKNEKITYEDSMELIKEKTNMDDKDIKKNIQYLSTKMRSVHDSMSSNEDVSNNNSYEEIIINNDYDCLVKDLEIENILNMIHEILLTLNEEQRFLMENRWLKEDPMTLKEVAYQLNMSAEGVRKMETRTLKIMRELIMSKVSNCDIFSIQVFFSLQVLMLEDF